MKHRISPSVPFPKLAVNPAALALAAFLAGLCAMMLAVYARMFLARLLYPLDLEWMEGGVLVHVQRLVEARPLYTAPSVDFIPFAYTPFYYVAVALPATFLGVSFFLARLISLLALASIPVAYLRALRTVESVPGRGIPWFALLAALLGLCLLLLEYFTTGAWLDLARADTLFLALTLWGGVVLVGADRGSHGTRAMIVAGVLFSLAFWTKQTALLFILVAGAWQLARDWRRCAILVITVAVLCGGGMLLLQWHSDGWAWFYLRRIHQLHTFDASRAWIKTPMELAYRLWPLGIAGLLGISWSAVSRKRPAAGVLFWWLFAICGVVTAAVGSGTQWAHINALLPAAVFLPPAVAASWTGWASSVRTTPDGDLHLCDAAATDTRRRLHMAWMLAGFAILLFHLHTRHPGAVEFERATPTAADRMAARNFIRTLRRMPGPILIPYHPWSAVLAGSPPHFHQHALTDIRGAGLPVPRDFTAGLRSGRWSTIVHDRHGHTFWRQWPGFTSHYRNTSAVRGRRLHTWAGNPCGPRTFWTPVTP
ncbi:DUF2029 domain-containing protein [Myxococcota bacterium]|nr:DUF2029 domain-containing protein [Myxococcota bacterium]MBU1510354.1 DUF2029 domain-containing protein [Myxococcota bacterium]